jgi:hypothetical protein
MDDDKWFFMISRVAAIELLFEGTTGRGMALGASLEVGAWNLEL